MQFTYQQYWTELNSLASFIVEEAEQQGVEANELASEYVGSHEYIIYYRKNLSVLLHTSNLDAIDDYGAVYGNEDTVYTTITRIAYFAMLQDVLDAIGDL